MYFEFYRGSLHENFVWRPHLDIIKKKNGIIIGLTWLKWGCTFCAVKYPNKALDQLIEEKP